MARATKKVALEPGSELAEALREAQGAPVELSANGATYRVVPAGGELTLWRPYDPESVPAALNHYAGSWHDVDAERIIANIYRAREEGTRPADRP